jgi:succinate dehydrogenase / fumarate reductase flavoprotein subunit
MPNAEEHIKRKLPSMYHQFKQLADIDITKEPMEVGPTTHYIMGGIRVDGDTQMSTVPGLFAAGECAAGLHGANRLGGNSLSDLLVFGKRAGEHAALYAKERSASGVREADVDTAAEALLAPFERAATGEGPFAIQHELQDVMQDGVGIVRREPEMEAALRAIDGLRERAARVGAPGNREYNPGWHTAIDLHSLLTCAEAVTRSAIEREESRGGHFRDDHPEKTAEGATYNLICRKGRDGRMEIARRSVPEIPAELKRVVEENA